MLKASYVTLAFLSLLLPLWTVQLSCFSSRQIVLKPANPDERKEPLGAHSTDFNFEPF